jgi:hypothetical protein
MWDPRRLTTLQASTACYGVSFPLLFFRSNELCKHATNPVSNRNCVYSQFQSIREVGIQKPCLAIQGYGTEHVK